MYELNGARDMDINVDKTLTQRIQSLVAEALQVPQEQVTADLAFGDLPQWDSLGHMEVMMRLEESFGAEINAETIAQLVSLPAIVDYVAGLGQEK
jgi:acyl carrier protein